MAMRKNGWSISHACADKAQPVAGLPGRGGGDRLRGAWGSCSLPGHRAAVIRSSRVVRAAMTARRFPPLWSDEKLDGWLPALETAADSVLVFALVTLVIVAPGFL